ncbi:MAG TPA: radical SAM family heme chaperone HemW [Myxococcota bacterium]|nr:radical SAM family heme chaperone HemW [Myxococcota bacterium]
MPFCATKCPYCAFATRSGGQGYMEWAVGVAAQGRRGWGGDGGRDRDGVDLVRGLRGPFETLYVGGGTPSLMPFSVLSTAIGWIGELQSFDSMTEITIEANPGDVTAQKCEEWLQLGFNRVSLGIQALDDNTLRFLGRRHDTAGAISALEVLRKSGFSNISIDLIYGLPEQSEKAWLATLQRAIDFDVEHISCYQLTIEDQTPFGRAVASGAMVMPDEQTLVEMFILTSHTLAKAGYEHYEVSNFAKAGFRAKHNSRYWDGSPYLGLGPAAHSYDGNARWWNADDLEVWLKEIQAPNPERLELINDDQKRLERLALGLRTSDGVPRTLVTNNEQKNRLIEQMISNGFLKTKQDVLVPTTKGMLVADAMAKALWD